MPALQDLIDADNPARYALLGAHYMDTVLPERAALYAAHVAAMDVGPTIERWAARMAVAHSTEYVKQSHFYCDWITMLLIKRYGEEPRAYSKAEVNAALAEGRTPNCSTQEGFDGWPLSFSTNDIKAALDLEVFHRWGSDLKIVRLAPSEG